MIILSLIKERVHERGKLRNRPTIYLKLSPPHITHILHYETITKENFKSDH